MTVEEKRKQLMRDFCGKVGSCMDCEIHGKCTSVSAMYTVSNMKDEEVEKLYAMDLKAHERKRTEVAEFCDEYCRCEGCPIKEQCDDYTNANPSEMSREKFDYFYNHIFKKEEAGLEFASVEFKRAWLRSHFCKKVNTCDECKIKAMCKSPDFTNEEEVSALFEKVYFDKRNMPEDTPVRDAEQPFDPVDRPQHYASTSIECIDAMIETQGEEAVIDFCVCNAFKYLWRHNSKNGDEDVRKANWYLNKAVELMDKYEKPIEF